MLGLTKNQRGDTIVEVTIAVALLSVILAAVYTVSGRAARLGQAAKERSQAVALVQQQAEIIESSAIRDWDSFIVDYRQNGSYDIETWETNNGPFVVPESAANYEVSYSSVAECPTGPCDADNITKIKFTITAEWIPVGGISSGSDSRETTKAVVHVSPSEVKR